MDPGIVKRRETRLFRNLKSLINMETNRCEDEILHFRTKYTKNYINKTTNKVNYANNILNNISRCSQLVLKLKGSLEKLRHMELEKNEDTNLNQETILHEKKHLKLQNDSNDILEICMTFRPL